MYSKFTLEHAVHNMHIKAGYIKGRNDDMRNKMVKAYLFAFKVQIATTSTTNDEADCR